MSAKPFWASQINLAVADPAAKWIYHHPEDQPLSRHELPPPRQLVRTIDNIQRDYDRSIRVTGRHIFR